VTLSPVPLNGNASASHQRIPKISEVLHYSNGYEWHYQEPCSMAAPRPAIAEWLGG